MNGGTLPFIYDAILLKFETEHFHILPIIGKFIFFVYFNSKSVKNLILSLD